jgi:hypothetical protein
VATVRYGQLLLGRCSVGHGRLWQVSEAGRQFAHSGDPQRGDLGNLRRVESQTGNRELDGRSITIQSVGKSQNGGANYEVRLAYQTSADSEAPGLRRTPSDFFQLAQSITLIATDGTQFNHAGGGGGGGGPQGSYQLLFSTSDSDLVPSKLIWKVPTSTRELVVPFSVTDLPIP